MQQIFITGAIGKDAETRQAGGGDVTSFNVAVTQGFGERKATNWFRCNMWGKRGSSLQPYLLKGGKVAVVGELTIGEYQGKPQYEVNASQVDLMGDGGKRQERQPERQQREEPRGGGGGFAADDMDDTPF